MDENGADINTKYTLCFILALILGLIGIFKFNFSKLNLGLSLNIFIYFAIMLFLLVFSVLFGKKLFPAASKNDIRLLLTASIFWVPSVFVLYFMTIFSGFLLLIEGIILFQDKVVDFALREPKVKIELKEDLVVEENLNNSLFNKNPYRESNFCKTCGR